MDDERIFGPLTFRQFLVVAVAAIVAYGAWELLAVPESVYVIALAAGAAFSLVRRFAPPPFDEEYVRRKRAALGEEGFARWVRQKGAMLRSQEVAREQRGLAPDPALAAARALVERVAAEGER